MSRAADEARLLAARRLRDAARATVHRDIATLRLDLTHQPLTRRARRQVMTRVAGTAGGARDLALEHRGVVALALIAALAWMCRRPLAALARTGWVRLLTRGDHPDS